MNLGVIRRIKPHLTRPALLSLYHSLIESNIRYCITVWKHGNLSVCNEIQNVCNKYLQLLTKSKLSCETRNTLMQDFNILNVNKLYDIELSIIMFKFHHGLLPDCFNNFFASTSSIHNIGIRNQNCYFIPFFKKTTSQQSLKFVGAKAWNLLPNMIKMIPNKSRFLKKLKKYKSNN